MRRPAALLGLLALLAACDQYSMTHQKKYNSYAEAPQLPAGSAMQQPVPGTVFRGALAERAVLGQRPPMTIALLERGRDRFDIFCAPCHGRSGDGRGIIVERGFPAPPSYHIDRLRAASDRHFLDVIQDGYGVMYSYAARVPPADRWAIVAYIRALQLGQHAAVADLPGNLRQPLEEQKH
jgi:mono/diheme cytochrome c family protein